MQRAVILRHPLEAAAVGFEFLELVGGWIVAVGAPADVQLFVVPLERDFLLIVAAATCGYGGMAFNTLLSGGGGRETAVQVTFLGREFAQRADGYRVGHDGVPCQVTLHTQTGIWCAWQKLSQRSWLSWSRSPGPLTSMSR